MIDFGFIKMIRSEETVELIKHPKELALLTLIAHRAKRTACFSAIGLSPGEALVGDYKSCGLSERQYRTAKSNLKKWGLATFKGTSKGTIAKLTNSAVYDINCEQSDEQNGSKRTSKRRASDDQATTNKECKEENNEKNKISSELSAKAAELDQVIPPVLSIQLIHKNGNGGREQFPIYQADIDGWKESFPSIDVLQTLREIMEWNLSNPTRNKTKSGIRKHITNWLTREQDRGGLCKQPVDRSNWI